MLDTDLTPQSYSWKKQIYFKQKLESPMCQRSSLEWEIFIGEVLSISDYTHFSVFTPISLRFAIIIKLIAWNFKPKPAQDIRHVWTPNFVYLKLLWPQFFYSWNCFYTENFLQKKIILIFLSKFYTCFFLNNFYQVVCAKIFWAKFYWPKIFLTSKKFQPTIFLHNIFWAKNVLTQYFFFTQHIFGPFFYFHTSFGQISFGPKKFVPKKCS